MIDPTQFFVVAVGSTVGGAPKFLPPPLSIWMVIYDNLEHTLVLIRCMNHKDVGEIHLL